MLDVLGGVASIFNSGASLYTSAKNLQYQRDNLDWQKQVQNTTWQREDDAVQRRAIDLQRSGMSPLLAAGGAANAGQVVSTQAPQMQSPQLDVASIISAMTQAAAIKKTEMDTRATEQQMRYNAQNQVFSNAILQEKSQQEAMASNILKYHPLNVADVGKDGISLARSRADAKWKQEEQLRLSQAAQNWQRANILDNDRFISQKFGLRSNDSRTVYEDLRLRHKQADMSYFNDILKGVGTVGSMFNKFGALGKFGLR